MGEKIIMAANNFKPFGISNGANVTSQADYEALAALLTGFTAGKASSAQVNKALRQGTVMASVLAQFIANASGNDVLDNGDTATIITNLIAALKANSANDFLQKTNNLSEIKNTGIAAQTSARTNLGLGNSATLNTGATAGTVATGNDSRIVNALQKGNNLSEISAAGAAAQSAALQNLGLASGAPPIGIPFYWPSAQLPNAVMTEWSNMVFLKWNGATFSAATYPKLALVVPSLRLTDVRGEFIRVFDDGRGVDSGRTLLSAQSDAIRNITGQIGYVQFFGDTTVSGALYGGGSQNLTNLAPGTSTISQSIFFDASKSVATANENRPRNIAFNFLVRAA